MLSNTRPSSPEAPARGVLGRARIAVLALAAILGLAATITASAHAAVKPIVFGIYPGGGAGAVGPSGETRPETPELRRQALLALRPAGRPFVLHLYDEYRTAADAAAVPAWLATQIAGYTADGFKIELVLPYRPSRSGGDVAGYLNFVRARVRQLGPNGNVTHLQITNEANIKGAPNAADGAYRGAVAALVRGVIAAKREARRSGHRHLRIGFNWADEGGSAPKRFFASLYAKGGRKFSSAVDWVGVDAYPGTWGPALPKGNLASAVRRATISTMRRLRTRLLPRARLDRAKIHFSECGYPTGPGRTQAMQRTVMRSAIRTVSRYRRKYGVTDFRWFDLRDADSSNPSFESQYGLTTDDYTPKPAFHAYRSLVKRLR